MNNSKLTGIERELVLQYLIDGNVPVTLTPLEDNTEQNDNIIKSLSSQIFPIAIKSEHLKINKEGVIALENPPQSVMQFANKDVKVEFYFNRVGLFFTSKVTETKEGLNISIPNEIERIKDIIEDKKYDFSAIIYFDCKNRKELNNTCIPCEDIELFTRPAWKIIPLENQKLAKELLEEFVEQAKVEKNAGNGILLIPVCKYLVEKHIDQVQAMENRHKSFSILFIDHERLVIGMNSKFCSFFPAEEYGVKLSFAIKGGPILTRDIYVTCSVNKIYRSKDKENSCVDLVFTTIQEEDLRFMFEKATSCLFI